MSRVSNIRYASGTVPGVNIKPFVSFGGAINLPVMGGFSINVRKLLKLGKQINNLTKSL